MHLAACLLNGYGVASDPERALDCVTQAAQQGFEIAQANLFRLFKACHKEVSTEIPVLRFLKEQAIRGSRNAMLDLKELDPREMVYRKDLLRFGCGGVGALWYLEDRFLHGITQSALVGKTFPLESLGPKTTLANVAVNIRGDKIIHAAAAVGAYNMVKELLDDYKANVDLPNLEGETALLCACRSGHPNIVNLLLDYGASASIQSANGETPLHWLLSFKSDVNISALGSDLIKRGGAIVDAFTTRRVSHSAFPATIDIDFQGEGTPLMWAVHDNKPQIVSFLLSKGADPNWQFQEKALSPLEWAAFYHHTECLKIMIHHLERKANLPSYSDGAKDFRHAVFYGPLIRQAVQSSDKFSMIMRNGAGYLDSLKSTFALLQEKTKLINFTVGYRETLLHLAAREAHDEACKIILESGWLVEQINQPAGLECRTALLESVRWNRRSLFHLLFQHGADATVLSASLYDETGQCTWSALHIFADQAHNDDLALVDDLIASGLFVDGNLTGCPDIETPYHIAVRRNAFRLADHLRSRGANPDALCLRSAFLIAAHPITGLGHTIALNARHSLPGLRYLLDGSASFIVEPARQLSALHLAACVPEGLSYVGDGTSVAREEFAWDTNRAIVRELLEWFKGPERLDARCEIDGKTALHLAAELGNLGVVEELVRAKADRMARSDSGETAGEVVKRVWSREEDIEISQKLMAWLE